MALSIGKIKILSYVNLITLTLLFPFADSMAADNGNRNKTCEENVYNRRSRHQAITATTTTAAVDSVRAAAEGPHSPPDEGGPSVRTLATDSSDGSYESTTEFDELSFHSADPEAFRAALEAYPFDDLEARAVELMFELLEDYEDEDGEPRYPVPGTWEVFFEHLGHVFHVLDIIDPSRFMFMKDEDENTFYRNLVEYASDEVLGYFIDKSYLTRAVYYTDFRDQFGGHRIKEPLISYARYAFVSEQLGITYMDWRPGERLEAMINFLRQHDKTPHEAEEDDFIRALTALGISKEKLFWGSGGGTGMWSYPRFFPPLRGVTVKRIFDASTG